MESRLFPEGTIPDCATPQWYADRDSAPHIDQWLHQDRLRISAELAAELVDHYDLGSIVDLGCGDGGLLSTLTHLNVPAWGYDLQPANIKVAREQRHVDARFGDVVNDPIDWGELAIATEMLEHLVDPHQFLAKVVTQAKALVASSPWSETAEHHYEHHLWAWDQDGYRALIEDAGFRSIARKTTGMFQVVAAVRP